MGTAIGAEKRKRTKRTPEQAEVPADGGLMEVKLEPIPDVLREMIDEAFGKVKEAEDERAD